MIGVIYLEKEKMSINGKRLRVTLEKFAEFGRTRNNGVTRLALSEEDRLVRDYFCACCRELGLSVEIDDIGNIYATLDGKEEKPPIVIGSHLDSVKKGGRFDGVLGVIAGLEVVRTFIDHNITPRIPITVVNFTNEEGARFEPSMMSSGILSGKFDKKVMFQKKDAEGITFEKALTNIGYRGNFESRLKQASAFLELHIEQGPILERNSISIGVVESVLGMVCYEIEVTGESNHAGTIPMNMRKDALFAVSNIISNVKDKLAVLDKDLVFTMGRLNIFPNIHTVIPNKVIFTIESRHKDPLIIRQVEEVIQGLKSFPNNEGCYVDIRKLWDRKTVWFNKKIVQNVEDSVKRLGYSYKRMDSGAGHDAQFIAGYIPSAMVFVPSVNGKSHCEEELTYWEDCEKGVNVILETVRSLLNEI